MKQIKKVPVGTTRHKKNITKDKVLQILIRAEGKAVSRKRLKSWLKVEDRVIRDCIAELRDDGWMIGVSEHGGYSFGNEEDFTRAIKIFESRRNEESKRIRKMKKTLEERRQIVHELVL